MNHFARLLLTLPKILPPLGRFVCPCMRGARVRVMLILMGKDTQKV